MENSSVKENVKLLMKELSLLMRIRPGGGEAENHRWSKIVQSSELEVHSMCQKIFELRNGSNTEMEIAKVELNTEVIHLMKHVKCLQECGNVQLLKRDQESDKPKMYSYEELGSFTGDFSTEIGSGGYANVYKGELPAGTDIAVKVLKEKDDLDTFFSELSTLGRNSHRYLVKLYGYCFEKEKKALVYEYMENGSFGNILYDNPRGLDWKKFYEIAISIAEGLSYLHHDCLETIIHYDIKPANVLIDSNLSPKIADFGLAKFMNQCLTHRTNTGLKGTENFVAPEVTYPGFEVNEKSDVYSFGMLLFEILGMKRLDRSKGWFPREVYKKLKAGELDQILKASHISQENSDDARILSTVALWCIQFKPTARPSMNKVVKMLRKKLTLRSPPDPFSQFAESSMPRIQEEAYSKSPPSTYDESSFRLHGRQIEEHIPTKYANNLLESVNMFESSASETLLQELAAEKPKRYSFEDLLGFTHNFSSRIGLGAYSKVYKGQFPNGVKVAVKILQEDDVVQEMFASEVSTMGRTSHRYLVKLYGYCVEKKVKALVYEYMEKGSFDKILYGNPLGLDWKKFYEIAIAIAKGISYLHDDCLATIIHRDVRAANALIDSKFSVKITDFGLAKLMKKDVSHLTSTGMMGTPSTIAPELMSPFAPVSPKIDVYGFGLLLFEILRMNRNNLSNTDRWFPKHVWEKFESGKLDEVLGECGIGPKNRTKAEILSKVALWCAQFTPSARPSMRTVVYTLETETCAWIPQNPFMFPENSSKPAKEEEEEEEEEEENQVLRQQALAISPTGKTLALRPKSTIIQRTPENGHMQNGEARHISDLSPAISGYREPESEERPQKSLNEKQQENQDLLIKCISQDLGFSGGRPVAACLIYKCLLHWRSFEVERTSVFDRIIQTIASAIEVQEENDMLSYWLSNSSTLLLLLQRTLKASGAASLTPQRRGISASLFGRMSQGLRGSPQRAGLDDMRQVEAKYPALLFKQQLTAFLEKIYGMIRDNLKKEISSMLRLCIQAPRASRARLVKGSRSQANVASIAHWQSTVKVLNTYLKTLRANYVSPLLVRKVFTQIFSLVNAELFNSLLLRRECCSFSNGEFVKSGLAELEQWCIGATEEYAGSAWDELRHIRQAVGFLVMHQKRKRTLHEITNELCPVLSIQQLYRISTMYWDDKYGTHSVSSDVLSDMRVRMTEESNNAVSSSFLLDNDSSIPFTVNDITKSMQQIDIADIDLPPLVRENSGFGFLLQRAD